MKHVGRSLPRPDAAIRAAGKGRHAADVRLPRMLHLRLVRSAVASGRLVGVDTADAAAAPGVRKVLTAADVASLPPIPLRVAGGAALEPFLQPVLAGGVVRYVGEPVAAVLADSVGEAEDAAELVAVDVAPTLLGATKPPTLLGATEPPARLGATEARPSFRATETPASFRVTAPPSLPSATAPSGPVGAAEPSLGPDPRRGCEAATARSAFGDLHAAFDAADRIVEVEVGMAREAAAAIELRASLADWDADSGTLTLWTVARAAHASRDALAAMLSLPRAAIRLETFSRGGGGELVEDLSPEDVLVAFAARLTGRPVRWVEDRREALLAGPQGRGLAATARAAVAADGRLLGIAVECALDQGAYLRPEGLTTAELMVAALPGPYRLGAFRAAAKVTMTNRPPAAALCSGGRIEATFVRERLLDAVAHELGLSPLELRRRNLVATGDRRAGPPGADPGRVAALVDAAGKRFGLEVLRRRCADRRDRGEFVGLGEALFVDPPGGGSAQVALAVDPSGTVELVTGAAPDARGISTELAQIVADVLGVAYDRIRGRFGDTCRIAFGPAAAGSREIATLAAAAQYAAEALRERILAGAGALLGIPGERLTIAAGRVREADRRGGATLELGDLAAALEPGGLGAARGLAGLSADGVASGQAAASPYGLAVALARIDPTTGIVSVPRAFVAYEAGNAINPALVEARLSAGVALGVIGALHADSATSAAGDPLRGNLADHALPTGGDALAVEILVLDEAPDPANPLGITGNGDGSAAGMTAAVAAAVDAALSAPGFVRTLPVRPAEVLAAVKARRAVPVA